MPAVILTFYLAFVVLAAYTGGQIAKSGGTDRASAPVKSLPFTDGKLLIGLPHSAAIGYPVHCSSSGDTFLDVYADEGSTKIKSFPDLYRVSYDASVSKPIRSLPDGYTELILEDFFASKHFMASLILAKKPGEATGPKSKKLSKYFVSISDLDGSNAKKIEIDAEFAPYKVALLESGDFLLLGYDPVNLVPMLALYSSGGDLKKYLDIDNRIYEGSADLKRSYSATQSHSTSTVVQKALRSTQFVPFGDKILLIQPGSSIAVYLIGVAGGEERRIGVNLPKNFLLQGALATDDQKYLIFRVRSVEDIGSFNTSHIVENPKEMLLQVDQDTGKVLAIFNPEGPHSSEISCVTHGRLAAVFYKPVKPTAANPSIVERQPAAGSDNPVTREDLVLALSGPLER